MFNGKPYINIREYYQRRESGTKMFAGKKGGDFNGRELEGTVKSSWVFRKECSGPREICIKNGNSGGKNKRVTLFG